MNPKKHPGIFCLCVLEEAERIRKELSPEENLHVKFAVETLYLDPGRILEEAFWSNCPFEHGKSQFPRLHHSIAVLGDCKIEVGLPNSSASVLN